MGNMKVITSWYQPLMWLLSLCIVVVSCKKDEEISSDKSNQLKFSYKYLDLSSEAITENVAFTAATDWQIINTTTWITISQQKGVGGKELTLTLSVAENESIGERVGEIILKENLGESADTLIVRQMGVSSAVVINWKETTVSQFDLFSGEIKLKFDGKIPHFRDGVSSIIIPTDSICYIRRIQKTSLNGKNVTLQTERGDMTDIFVNQNFTLSTKPDLKAFITSAGGVRTTDDSGVIHPVKITTSMTDGTTRVIYDLYDSSDARSTFYPIQGNFLFYDYKYDKSGQTIYRWEHAQLLWDKCFFSAKLDGHFYFSFGKYKIVGDKLKSPKGELLNFYYFLEGVAELDLMLRMIAEKEYVVKTERPVVLMSGIPSVKGVNFYFPIGNCLLSVNVNADICTEASLEAKAKAELTAGFSAKISLKAGASYTSNSSELKPILDADASFIVHKPELSVKGSIHAQATVYPHIRIRFFDFAGPNINIKPYIADSYGFGAKVGGTGEDTYVGWDNRTYTFTQVETNLALDFAGKKLWESQLLKMSLVEENDLYRAPDKIQVMTDTEKEYKPFTPIPVKVRVTAFSKMKEENLIVKGAVVKFSSQNSERLNYNMLTDEAGEAIMNWTPESENDCLQISVLSAQGKAIDEVEFRPNINKEYEVTLGKIIDLGLSVKWASCNLGANKPEEYGRYFPFKSNMNSTCSDYLVGGLRLPTKDNMEELVTKCKSKWINYNGIEGVLVIGPNKNTIFLPAAGYFINVVYEGISYIGEYWSGTTFVDFNKCSAAYTLRFSNNKYDPFMKLWVASDNGPDADPGHYKMYHTIRAVAK